MNEPKAPITNARQVPTFTKEEQKPLESSLPFPESPITQAKETHDLDIAERASKKQELLNTLSKCLELLTPLLGSPIDIDLTIYHSGQKCEAKIKGAIALAQHL